MFVAIGLYAWDVSRPGWNVTHGGRFVALVVLMWFFALTDAWLVRRSHIPCYAAMTALTLAPILNLDGGGAIPRILGWLTVVVVACWFAGKAILKKDVAWGSSAFIGGVWLLHIGIHNVFRMTSHSGFWSAEIT